MMLQYSVYSCDILLDYYYILFLLTGLEPLTIVAVASELQPLTIVAEASEEQVHALLLLDRLALCAAAREA